MPRQKLGNARVIGSASRTTPAVASLTLTSDLTRRQCVRLRRRDRFTDPIALPWDEHYCFRASSEIGSTAPSKLTLPLEMQSTTRRLSFGLRFVSNVIEPVTAGNAWMPAKESRIEGPSTVDAFSMAAASNLVASYPSTAKASGI